MLFRSRRLIFFHRLALRGGKQPWRILSAIVDRPAFRHGEDVGVLGAHDVVRTVLDFTDEVRQDHRQRGSLEGAGDHPWTGASRPFATLGHVDRLTHCDFLY